MTRFLHRVFRVLEIRSRENILHFRRWRLLENRWFRLFVHEIYQRDEDAHPHSHPWNFLSWVVKGGYIEGSPQGHKVVSRWGFNRKSAKDYHKILQVLSTPTITIVFSWGPYLPWGYLTQEGFVEKDQYRFRARRGDWDNLKV